MSRACCAISAYDARWLNKELQKALNQFAQRLRNIKFGSFKIIDANSGLPELKRGSDGARRLGNRRINMPSS